MDEKSILQRAIELGASDLFLVAGLPVTYKVRGSQQREGDRLMPADTEQLIRQIYELSHRNPEKVENPDTDDDFSFAVSGLGRFRVNVMHQRGSLGAVIRVIRFGLPQPEQMNIPPEVMKTADFRNGMVLVTGQAGSGKSTTLACLIDSINRSREGHIITMEDPIEYVHRHGRSIVTQREIYTDCPSYISAIRSALRESPDVLLLGEMRDRETIEVAMTAAETGQLLFSTLHTTSAAGTVDRIVDTFPGTQQPQVRVQLAMVLRAVISQQLVPSTDGGLVPAFEVMYVNMAIRNLIREARTHQIDAAIQAGAAEGMRSMDDSLLALFKSGKITMDTALSCAAHPDILERRLRTR